MPRTPHAVPLLSNSNNNNNNNVATRLPISAEGSESYSSNSSFSDSYSSDDDSSDLANWEEYVGDDGRLFYAEYYPNLKKHSNGALQNKQHQQQQFTRNVSSLRMGKKIQRNKQPQQQQHQQQRHHTEHSNGTNRTSNANQPLHEECKFSHINRNNNNNNSSGHSENNHKQLELIISATDRYRYGRRSTAVESILGFRVIPYPDQMECLMFDSFIHQNIPEEEASTGGPAIKRGDWFKSLDGIEIRTSNVDELLMQFVEPTKVCLQFVGPSVDAETGNNDTSNGGADSNVLKKIENFNMFAELFEKSLLHSTTHTTNVAEEEEELLHATANAPMPFALLILPPEYYQSDQHKDSLYYYPADVERNFLFKARGSFLTLNAVLSAELQTKPTISKLLIDNWTYYVSYRTMLNGFLMLIAFAADYQTMSECTLRSDELAAYWRFTLPALNLDNFASSNIMLRKFLDNFCTIQQTRLLTTHQRHQQQHSDTKRKCTGAAVLFEELLKESRQMALPKEAQLRIFDALSEMEAMDYRNWNDEPLNTHREFFIHGSILYYDHFLLASQMPVEMRSMVECFLRCRGIFDFIAEQSVRELYVWEEIMLPGATSSGRYFLTICSRSHLILAVILKIFDAPDLMPSNGEVATIPPSLFYIEEIQETLAHLIQCGIESLAMFWSISNKRPEVVDQVDAGDDYVDGSSIEKTAQTNTAASSSSKLETFLKQKLIPSSSSTTSSSAASAAATAIGGAQSQRSTSMGDEDATHTMCSSLGGSSIRSLTPSEDDATSKRVKNAANDSDSGGSDWENFTKQNNPLHYGLDAETQTQMTESLWREINNVVPVKISAGWKNAIFYYVYVDNANGSVFCPLKANSESFPFLREMRKACHLIHNTLEGTKNFRRLLQAQETGAAAGTSTSISTGNNGMLAIKEHSITIQICERNTKADDTCGNGAAIKGRFVVVGRLFYAPTTKEVYVCHRPDVPQNMIEMAFRLSFFSVG